MFKEHLSVAASVSEYMWSRILENLPKLSKILAVIQHYKKTPMIKYF